MVAPADRLEQRLVAPERSVAHGPDRIVAELRPVEERDLAQVGQAERRGQRVDLERRQLHVPRQELANPLRHVLAHFQPDDRTEVPLAHDLDDRAQQVARLVLPDFEIRVARDPEGVGGGNLESGEEQVEIRRDQLFDPDEPAAPRLEAEFVAAAARRPDQPRQRLGHLDPGEALALIPVVDDHRQVQAQVRHVGKRVARIERERRQDGEDVALEVGPQLALLLGRKGVVRDDLDPLVAELRQQVFAPTIVEAPAFPLEVGADAGQLLGRRHAVRRRLERAPLQLPAQTRDADHEELVQVAAVDRQELDPLEQRVPRVARLLQHPAVEPQPAQLAVDVVLGKPRRDGRRGPSGSRARFRLRRFGRNRRGRRLERILSGRTFRTHRNNCRVHHGNC